MSEAKLAPNLPQWMKDHTDRYLKSGGTDGHMYTINLPNLPSREVPSLLLTTTGRKSGASDPGCFSISANRSRASSIMLVSPYQASASMR